MSLQFFIEMRRVIQNYVEKGPHTGKRELLPLTEDIGVHRPAKSFGMMWSKIVSVVGSWSLISGLLISGLLVSGLARLQFSMHIKNWHWASTVRTMSGSNLMHYRRPKVPRYVRFVLKHITVHTDKGSFDTPGSSVPCIPFSYQLPKYAVIMSLIVRVLDGSCNPSRQLYHTSLHSYVAPRKTRLASSSLRTQNSHSLLPL